VVILPSLLFHGQLLENQVFHIPRNPTISYPSPQSFLAPFLVRYRRSTHTLLRDLASRGWTRIGDKELRYRTARALTENGLTFSAAQNLHHR
jgi:hypothetical protein